MADQNLLEYYKKLENLIGFCYEKYKLRMTESERDVCEEYLYDQGEYELALDSVISILKYYKIDLDQECSAKIEEAKKLMEIK